MIQCEHCKDGRVLPDDFIDSGKWAVKESAPINPDRPHDGIYWRDVGPDNPSYYSGRRIISCPKCTRSIHYLALANAVADARK